MAWLSHFRAFSTPFLIFFYFGILLQKRTPSGMIFLRKIIHRKGRSYFVDCYERHYSKIRNKMQEDKLKKNEGQKLGTYRGRKIVMEEAYKAIGKPGKAARIRACGSVVKLDEYEDGSTHVHSVSHCCVRLCQICSKRWARNALKQLSQVVGHMEREHDYRWVFLTLSFRNTQGPELAGDVDHHMDAIHRFEKYKAVKDAFAGSFRKLEIRHNFKHPERGYNTHFHVLAAVEPEYFKSKAYLTKAKLTELWKKAGKAGYEPHVWVKAVELKGETLEHDQALLEASKYVTKSNDYIAPRSMKSWERRTAEAAGYLDAALANRRLIGRGGEIKRVHKLLCLADDPMNEQDGGRPADSSFIVLKRIFKWDYDNLNYIQI
jgi:plasmid rolling circle replication initiator protein Rep